MTAEEIKDYAENIGKLVTFFGYTSCSLQSSTAFGFAWENKDSGHSKVLFHIIWNSTCNHYFLNGGAYDHEEEILLLDGTAAKVESVEEIKNEKGEVLYTLIKMKS